MSDFVVCPFCKEFDFDLIGLKSHLMNGSCKIFESTETPAQERQRKGREAKESGE